FKILSSLSFLFGGIHQASLKYDSIHIVQERRHAIALVAGLAFSLLGDIFLIPSRETIITSALKAERTSASFQIGTFFFALAHISYIIAFASHASSFRLLPFVLSATTCIILTQWLGILESNPTPNSRMIVPPELTVLVRSYVGIIIVMVSVATATDEGWQRTFGAWIFMISDMFVAGDVFGNKKTETEGTDREIGRKGWKSRSFGWLSYFWAQMLLAGCI
ncbi:YhhN-like protein, partial [Cyathus striatus]